MRILVAAIALLVFGSWANHAHAADAKLNWTKPEVCVDGSPVTNCPTSGFEIWQGIGDAVPTLRESLNATYSTRSYTGLPAGKVCWYLKTISGNGGKSAASITVCPTLVDPPPPVKPNPSPPGSFTVTTSTLVTATPPTP